MDVRKLVNIYFTEDELKEAMILFLRENGREDMATHVFENDSLIDVVKKTSVDKGGTETQEDIFVLCVDGEVDDSQERKN